MVADTDLLIVRNKLTRTDYERQSKIFEPGPDLQAILIIFFNISFDTPEERPLLEGKS